MPAERYLSPEEVRKALRCVYRADPETNLQAAFLRTIADPLRPVDATGRWKPNPVLILIFIISCAFLGVFLFFSMGARP